MRKQVDRIDKIFEQDLQSKIGANLRFVNLVPNLAESCLKILCVAEQVKNYMNGQNRKDIKAGITVEIVLKQDQRTGRRTRGIVRDILTNSPTHPHGIKVRLDDGQVGRVQEICD